MNPHFTRWNLLFLIVTLVATACTSTRTVSINAVQPPQIKLHKEIQTIVLVDRTVHERKVLGIIEGVLTGVVTFCRTVI